MSEITFIGLPKPKYKVVSNENKQNPYLAKLQNLKKEKLNK